MDLRLYTKALYDLTRQKQLPIPFNMMNIEKKLSRERLPKRLRLVFPQSRNFPKSISNWQQSCWIPMTLSRVRKRRRTLVFSRMIDSKACLLMTHLKWMLNLANTSCTILLNLKKPGESLNLFWKKMTLKKIPGNQSSLKSKYYLLILGWIQFK